MNPNLYDEFGNYIGPDDLDGNVSEPDLDNEVLPVRDADMPLVAHSSAPASTPFVEPELHAVILHENKEYYPSAEQVFGPDVEVLVQEEDAQPLSVPIIAPAVPANSAPSATVRKVAEATRRARDTGEYCAAYDDNYLLGISQVPELIRNVALVGHLHHGKTSIVDLLVEHTHPSVRWDLERSNRFTDTHPLARLRGLSTKMMPVSLVTQGLNARGVPASRSRTHLLHIMDTPGHADFVDEPACALRLADGAVLVVDAAEGLMANTERLLRRIVADRITVCLVISKIDRLVTELKLPPNDAYLKLRCIIEEINKVITSMLPDTADHDRWRLSPERNNVCFASAEFGFCFTLSSFAAMYIHHYGMCVSALELGSRLWGNIYYNKQTRKFQTRSAPGSSSSCSFVTFIMEPLYKVFSVLLGETSDHITQVFTDNFGISFKKKELEMDIAPLMRLAFSRLFEGPFGFIDMVIQHVPNPKQNAKAWVSRSFTGNVSSPLACQMMRCAVTQDNQNDSAAGNSDEQMNSVERDSPLVMHITKLYPSEEDSSEKFYAFGRVVSGAVCPGTKVRVLGEGFCREDEEDSVTAVVSSVAFYQSRYKVPVNSMGAGNLVLLGGIAQTLVKTGTVVGVADSGSYELAIFLPLRHLSQSVMKVAIEPQQPSELPKMLDALRKINKTYPLSVTKVEESGEHILLGTGEMYLDCILHDLRRVFSEIEIKVSDPSARFCETVSEISAFKCFAESPNKRNKITMIAEPLATNLAKEIEEGGFDKPDSRATQGKLEKGFGWDMLAAASVWSFGPEEKCGPNILMDDTLADECEAARSGLMRAIRDGIKQGFQWGTREGPLCDEPVRGVRFKILDALVAPEPMHRGGGQIIPTARRLVHASLLMASPRLMEPVYLTEIQIPEECKPSVYNVLARRRGHIISEYPKSGSPLTIVKAYLPVMDSFGFETDLRTHTQGQAFCQSLFDHFQMAPGDPLDRSIVLKPLEPADPSHIARDFMLKTRRRKGLSEDVSAGKYLDDPMLLELAREALGGTLGNFL